jgi:hypothetical protein
MCLLNIETSAGKTCGYLKGGDSGVRSYEINGKSEACAMASHMSG